MKSAIHKMLLSVGITPDLSGFNLIVEAIQIKVEEPEIGTTKIYKKLATVDSYANVERKIRHAVSKADRKAVESLFDTEIPTGKEKFKNEQFIALCALKIKEG